MSQKVLIVEDNFIEADYLKMMLTNNGYEVNDLARSVSEAKKSMKMVRPTLVLLDIFLKGESTGIDLAHELKKDNIAFIYLSANSDAEVLKAVKLTEPYGFLIKPFREKDLLIAIEIALYRHEHSMETKQQNEEKLKVALSGIQDTTAGPSEKIMESCAALQRYVPFDILALYAMDQDPDTFQILILLRIGFKEYQMIGHAEFLKISGATREEIQELSLSDGAESQAGIYDGDTFEKPCRSINGMLSHTFGLMSNLLFPPISHDGKLFSLHLFRRKKEGFKVEQLNTPMPLLQQFVALLKSASFDPKVQNRMDGAIQKDKPVALNGRPFKDIIGNSPALLRVLDLAHQVSSSDTSVLILGESGTGKEKLADCIHQLSPRKKHPFIKINCAALPPTLIESELFGYEKGAFTDATHKRIGKFEQADKGTIMLDEIGEMPLNLQVRLLRVLQEREVERIGSKGPIKVDVRIITATNRNLEKEVAAGRFRLDLYYRLNVFPITMPPLRERLEDIPLLAGHFVQLYNRKIGKHVNRISNKALNEMLAYPWPGNIREMENLIERSIILTKGPVIDTISLNAPEPGNMTLGPIKEPLRTLEENERDYIIGILKRSKGKIWGKGAAAEIMGIPPSTLKSKMKKLGIEKDHWH